jgi:hypothetical protein
MMHRTPAAYQLCAGATASGLDSHLIRSGIGYPSDIQDSLASGVRSDDLDEAVAILDQFIAQTNRGGSNADESNQARSESWRRAESISADHPLTVA